MKKRKKIKVKFHWTHFVAIAVLISYFVFSKVNTVYALTRNNFIESFMQLYLFGIVFASLFLYIFSHDKFLPFAKEIEKKEQKKEKKYIKKYLHHGKIFGTFVIGVIGGPIFSSLTARLLLNNYWYKYLVIIIANIPSTFITVGIAKGVIHFL